MLDAACPGAVFTSPVPDQMAAATQAVDGGAGVVHIVKNYTGDVLNFRMAAELAEDEGIEVETVLMDDDVAVAGQPLHGRAAAAPARPCWSRRSPARRAEAGGSLAEVAGVARRVERSGRSSSASR